MKAAFFLLYAAVAYVVGVLNIVYILGFILDVGVPKSIVDGPTTNLWAAIAIDAALVLGFGLHHSITARASFKRWWTKIVPAPIERATYLYMTALVSIILVVFWRPIPVTIWEVNAAWGQAAFYTLFATIAGLMVASTFHFGHFSFFGLTQAWERFRRKPPAPGNMTAKYLYALVRHPISVGWMALPWLTPHLTLGHVVFALATVVYILAATPFEEADLIDELGDEYLEYRKRVPAFVPGVRRRAPPAGSDQVCR